MDDRCSETRIVAGKVFVCINPPHPEDDPTDPGHKLWGAPPPPPRSQRHWFVAEDRVKTAEP